MQRQPFDSSVILAADYDPATRTLEIEFRNHRIYRYLNVPPAAFAALRTADSAGHYFATEIRNDYECWRLVNRAHAKHRTRRAPR